MTHNGTGIAAGGYFITVSPVLHPDFILLMKLRTFAGLIRRA
jgi:hypothetical protein